MNGQISIFDLGIDKPDVVSPAQKWFNDTGLTDYWQTDITFINDIPVCRHSKHSCNRLELFKVADSLDDIECKKVCCRKCDIKGCGARCNGSEEPKLFKNNNVNPCECGNDKLAIQYTGCGIPVGGYKSYPLVYEKFLYNIFCPICWRTATEKSLGWRSNKTNIKDALKDWNENPRKIEDTQFIYGRYGKSHYAACMKETITLFPSVIETLGHDHVYLV